MVAIECWLLQWFMQIRRNHVFISGFFFFFLDVWIFFVQVHSSEIQANPIQSNPKKIIITWGAILIHRSIKENNISNQLQMWRWKLTKNQHFNLGRLDVINAWPLSKILMNREAQYAKTFLSAINKWKGKTFYFFSSSLKMLHRFYGHCFTSEFL